MEGETSNVSQTQNPINTNSETRKDKTDAPHVGGGGGGGGGSGGIGKLSPNTEQPLGQSSISGVGTHSHHAHVTHGNGNSGNTGVRDQHVGVGGHKQNSKLERPNTLGGTNQVSRRINICYHNEHYPDGGPGVNNVIGGPPGSTPPPYTSDGKMTNAQGGGGGGGDGRDCRDGRGNVGAGGVLLSELPEPPIPVSEIGPIPPPPMFSTPSPTLIAGRPHGPGAMNDQGYQDYDYDGRHACGTICLCSISYSYVLYSDKYLL
ncbi:unnamed protein product [Ceratitis capitata]|uniref:(Mediterranean fruit fly) hypothetical protein n=1 Tax=Ceratitis capitata TaxID=7213 RepID=A0A811UX72_CERCA|nr:unnamed protein product [Ceratitis capitata]